MGRFAFVIALPSLPLLGYWLSGASRMGMEPDRPVSSHLQPQPRITGFPAVDVPTVDEPRRGPSPFSLEALKDRSSRWTFTRMETPRWRLVLTERFAVRSDLVMDDLRYAGACLEEAYSALEGILGGGTGDLRFSARIFRSRDAFTRYAGCLGVKDAVSFYDPATYEIVAFRDEGAGRERLGVALFHETAHIYIHRVFGRTGPLWLTEGVAEYVSRFRVSAGRVRVGEDDPAARTALKAALDRGTWIPLLELLEMVREAFYGPRYAQAYAQSWLLIRTLLPAKSESFPDILRPLLDGFPLSSTRRPELVEEQMRALATAGSG